MHSFFYLVALFSACTLAQPRTRFIVKLKQTAAHDEVLSFFSKARSFSASSSGKKPSEEDDPIRHHYNDTWFSGFAGEFNNEEIQEFNETHGNDVEYIEPDNPVKAYLQSQNNAPWGLAEISFKGRNSDSFVFPDSAGKGVDVWVLDTGVFVEHPDFQGRARRMASFVKNEDDKDYAGHGTHVAGTIAGVTFGVAKKARVLAVKVLDHKGDGWDSRIIAGINYAIKQHKSISGGKKKLAVMNLSLGGQKSRAMDEAVKAAKQAGIVVIVAAGNEHTDACRLSPSGSADVFAVGAIDKRDRIASFSNYGRCVRAYAPGQGIISAGNRGGSRSMSGTSMASPHVAGIAALYIADRHYDDPQQVYQDLQHNSRPLPDPYNLPNFKIPVDVPSDPKSRHSLSEDENTTDSLPTSTDLNSGNTTNSTLVNATTPLNTTNSTISKNITNGAIVNNTAPLLNTTNSTANDTLPRNDPSINNSTTDVNLTPLIDDLMITPGEGCVSGQFACNGDDFKKCDNDKWVNFKCAPNTACRSLSDALIICDYPSATQQDDVLTSPEVIDFVNPKNNGMTKPSPTSIMVNVTTTSVDSAPIAVPVLTVPSANLTPIIDVTNVAPTSTVAKPSPAVTITKTTFNQKPTTKPIPSDDGIHLTS